MQTRRNFLKHVGIAGAGTVLAGSFVDALQQPGRRQVTVGGRRIRTIDVHAHTTVPEVREVFKNTPFANAGLGATKYDQLLPMSPDRIRAMDEQGIDMQVLTINPYWYAADLPTARDLIQLQNERLSQMCAAQPDRFVALATVALQHPELAAEQLETAVRKLGLRGAAIGGSVGADEIASRRFDPFWAKAEQLGVTVFTHPQGTAAIAPRVQGSGALGNVIGNPLETTLALSHLIFEGTLDRFQMLKICAAHGGGYLGSYTARSDNGCRMFPEQCGVALKKKPTEYLKQLYFDSLVFTPEALRHLVAEHGASQIVIGTDFPYPWTTTSVEHVMATPGLTDAERIGILGGNAARLLGLPA